MTDKIFKKHDWKYKVGLTLTIFSSIIIGIFNIGVLYLFGIPLLLLLAGIFLIALAEEEVKTKVFLILLPIPIIISIFSSMYWLNKAEPETFLIPQDFRGKITIFYEEPCGEKPIYESGRRIYKFPENGILITNFKRTKGFLDQEFYFVDENGNRNKIPKKDVRDFNFNGRLSKTETKPSRYEIGAFFSWGDAPPIFIGKYNSFIISSYRYFEKSEKESWQIMKDFSEKRKSLLGECRQSLAR